MDTHKVSPQNSLVPSHFITFDHSSGGSTPFLPEKSDAEGTSAGGTTGKTLRLPNYLIEQIMQEAAQTSTDFTSVCINRMVGRDLVRKENTRLLAEVDCLKKELEALRLERKDSYDLMVRAAGGEGEVMLTRIEELEQAVGEKRSELRYAQEQLVQQRAERNIEIQSAEKKLDEAHHEISVLKDFIAASADTVPVPALKEDPTALAEAEKKIHIQKAELKALRNALLESSPYTRSEIDHVLDNARAKAAESIALK